MVAVPWSVEADQFAAFVQMIEIFTGRAFPINEAAPGTERHART